MIIPLFLVVVFTIITASLYYYGRAAAQSAASACAETARTLSGSAGDGQAAATSVLNSSNILTQASISVDRGAVTTTCTVSGTVVGPITLPLSSIHRSVTMPTERITQP